MDASFLLIAAIVTLAFFVQAATGFGAMVVALTLGAFFYPVNQLLNWFVPQVLLLSSYMLLKHHEAIDWRLLLRNILPFMGAGLLLGQLIYYRINTQSLTLVLGLLVALLSVRALLSRANASKTNTPLWPWTASAGVVHGLIAAGGPLLVYGLNQQPIQKATFRSTLLLVWLIMGLGLLLSFISSGQLTTAELPRIGLLALCLPVSVIAGEWAHKRLNQVLFEKIINLILLFCGVALLF